MRLRPHGAVQPRNSFDIMVEDIGLSIEDNIQCFFTPHEIWDKHFNRTIWNPFSDLLNRAGENVRTAIIKFIAIDGRNNGMTKIHQRNRFAYSSRLIFINKVHLSRLHITKTATASAGVTENHERSRSGIPALTHIRTACLFANGMEFSLFDHVLQTGIILPSGNTSFQPFRFSLNNRCIQRFYVIRRTLYCRYLLYDNFHYYTACVTSKFSK